MANGTPIFAIEDLTVRFATPEGEVSAVNGMSLSLTAGESLAIVGESGAGKTQAFLAVMGLLASNGRATGRAMLDGADLLAMPPHELDKYRGKDIAMVFQDPMTALNPALRISRQLTEPLEVHQGYTHADAEKRALAMLKTLDIPDAEKRFSQYPHQLSGGMRQRVMIAMALLCQPKLLIADEPTTALDVTIQAQILELFADMKARFDTALVMITHDLGIVAGLADRVVVMYAGRIVEDAPVDALFEDPQHPYTRALLGSTPRFDAETSELHAIVGQPPNLQRLPPGCAFHPRCPLAIAECTAAVPPLTPVAGQERRMVACIRAGEAA
mgnify:CR=1 FL=1